MHGSAEVPSCVIKPVLFGPWSWLWDKVGEDQLTNAAACRRFGGGFRGRVIVQDVQEALQWNLLNQLTTNHRLHVDVSALNK